MLGIRGYDLFLSVAIEYLFSLLIGSEDQQGIVDVDLVGESLFEVQLLVLPVGERIEKRGHDGG